MFFKMKCLNPQNQQFADHFAKMKKKAEYTQNKNLVMCYSKIIKSISRYPLPILSGEHALLLEGVGPNSSKFFDEVLSEGLKCSSKSDSHAKSPSKKSPHSKREKPESKRNKKIVDEDEEIPEPEPAPSIKKKKVETIEEGSDNYVFLLCVYIGTLMDRSGKKITQEDVEKIFPELKRQLPEISKKTSIKKKGRLLEELNYLEWKKEEGCRLTTEGLIKAKELLSNAQLKIQISIPTNPLLPNTFEITKDIIKIYTPPTKSVQEKIQKIEREMGLTLANNLNLEESKIIEKPRADGKIVLIIDTREVKTKKDRSYMYEHITANHIQCEQRALPLGDALWVFKKEVGENEWEEYVLPYIVERKKVDDLASSIMDGRYVEQKRRLRKCPLSKVVYIVEGEASLNCRVGKNSLQTAVVHTRVISGFTVFKVTTIEETVKWLCMWTERITALENSNINIEKNCLTYETFKEEFNKNPKVPINKIFQNSFGVINGCSGLSAGVLARMFRTPLTMFQALNDLGTAEEREKLITQARTEGEKDNTLRLEDIKISGKKKKLSSSHLKRDAVQQISNLCVLQDYKF